MLLSDITRNLYWSPASAYTKQSIDLPLIRHHNGHLYQRDWSGLRVVNESNTFTPEWIIDFCVEDLRGTSNKHYYHFESVKLEDKDPKRGRYVMHALTSDIWCRFPERKYIQVEQLYLSLRIGGYLIDSWTLYETEISSLMHQVGFSICWDEFRKTPLEVKGRFGTYAASFDDYKSCFVYDVEADFPRFANDEETVHFRYPFGSVGMGDGLDAFEKDYRQFFLAGARRVGDLRLWN